jgi:hypothetical protein
MIPAGAQVFVAPILPWVSSTAPVLERPIGIKCLVSARR